MSTKTVNDGLTDALACATAARAIIKLAEEFDARLKPQQCWAAKMMLDRVNELLDENATDQNGLHRWPLVPVICGSIEVLGIGAGRDAPGLPCNTSYMLGINIEMVIRFIQDAFDSMQFDAAELTYG